MDFGLRAAVFQETAMLIDLDEVFDFGKLPFFDALYLLNFVDGLEGPMLIAVFDDRLGFNGPDSRKAIQLLGGSRINVNLLSRRKAPS